MEKRKQANFKDRIVIKYHEGMSVNELCKRYKLSRSTLYSWISNSKKVSVLKKHKSSEFKMKIIELINEGSSIKDICTIHKLSKSTVYNWVNKYSEESSKRSNKKNVVDKELFDQTKELFKIYSITNSMTLREKIELIKIKSDTFSITLLCQLFGVNRSTYYKVINNQASAYVLRDEFLKKKIKEIVGRHRFEIKAAKIKATLEMENITVGIGKVRYLMRELGLSSKSKKKWKYPKDKDNPLFMNVLNQNFNQMVPNRVWASDITELKINYKPVYLCVIMDLFSRKIISYEISKKNNTRLTTTTFKKAMKNRKTIPYMFHSDRGVQYASKTFRNLIKSNNIIQSFSAAGYPYDNAPLESFFSHFKVEAMYKKYPYSTIQEYKKLVTSYIDFHNKDRLHQGIGLLTPNHKEGIYKKAMKHQEQLLKQNMIGNVLFAS